MHIASFPSHFPSTCILVQQKEALLSYNSVLGKIGPVRIETNEDPCTDVQPVSRPTGHIICGLVGLSGAPNLEQDVSRRFASILLKARAKAGKITRSHICTEASHHRKRKGAYFISSVLLVCLEFQRIAGLAVLHSSTGGILTCFCP